MDNYFPINMINSGQTAWLKGDITQVAGISMSGNNTVGIANHGIWIHNIVANNGNNVVLVPVNDSVLVNQTYYKGGDVLVGPNPSNNINFISCTSVALATIIEKFELRNDYVEWKVNSTDQIEIQYTEESKNPKWRSIYWTVIKEGRFPLPNSGFYRLKVGEEYSTMITYGMNILKPVPNGEDKLYYNGKGYSEEAVVLPNGLYGKKSRK